ncbi:MAG: hypothetical protein IH622_23050 [Ochrobactrum anthropi]|uniref:Uncharacterized protein n=1 Tax=Brucella anthropi TaxID=529 RepID=A0A8I0N9T2_BRUAN|nr:hypothetical protein [Brucella anthropi]MBE0563675.1 hypothetical protein [Brucella anthropi]
MDSLFDDDTAEIGIDDLVMTINGQEIPIVLLLDKDGNPTDHTYDVRYFIGGTREAGYCQVDTAIHYCEFFTVH